jgi:cell division protein FtsB
MAIDFDSNKIPSREERGERVLDLHFNQNKNYRQIAQEMKMSLRDIGEIVNRAKEEKERQEHKSLSVQAYDKFFKGKTPLQVAIDLNIGQAQTTQYYSEYLKLMGLEDITKLYIEFKGDVSYFVSLCKEAKVAKMGVSQVINLLMIANNYLPSVQRRHEQLQNENIILDSNLRSAAREFQNLSNQITYMNKRLDDIKSECSTENATLEYLRQQIAKLEAFVYNFKSNDDGYTKLIKTIEEEVLRILSNKKALLKLAVLSIDESIRNNPDRYGSLISSRNDNSNSSLATVASDTGQYIGPDDLHISQNYHVEMLLEEAEKLYNSLAELFVREVVNESVSKQSAEAIPSSLPTLPLEGDGNKQEHTEQNDVLPKYKQ